MRGGRTHHATALRRDYPGLLATADIEIGDGWHPVVRDLMANLTALVAALPDNERREVRVVQVKQKLGGLRVYVQEATPDIERAIYWARGEAYWVCEGCGRRVRHSGENSIWR